MLKSLYSVNYPCVDLFFTSDVITFDQNWHHLYSSSAGGKDLTNDTQNRMIGSVESEISTKMLRNLSENSEQNCLQLHVATPW